MKKWITGILVVAAVITLIFICTSSMGGCSYMIPNSTSIKPAVTKIEERTSVTDPGANSETTTQTITIIRGAKPQKGKLESCDNQSK